MGLGEVGALPKPGLDFLVLCRKSFPLSRGLTFSEYLKDLDEVDFSTFFVALQKPHPSTACRLDIVPLSPLPPAMFIRSLFGWIILNQCVVSHSRGRSEVTLPASVGWEYFFLNLLILIPCLILFGTVLIAHFDWLGFVFGILPISWVALVYNRDSRRLDKLGACATKPTKKGKG